MKNIEKPKENIHVHWKTKENLGKHTCSLKNIEKPKENTYFRWKTQENQKK
jgi:uncharacterized membrane protein